MDKDTRKVVKAAQARGWVQLANGKHHIIQHPSGKKVTFSMSPSCQFAAKQVERDIERVEREAQS